MSVLIKGIGMPEDCNDCPFQCNAGGMWESGEDYCTAIQEQHNTPKAGVPNWCPLVALPEKHGRLIDADALNLDYEVEMADDWKTAHEFANIVKYAPIVIEAEGGGENV